MLKKIEYTESAVCFMDILGFRALIESSVGKPDMVEAIGKIVGQVMQRTRQRSEERFMDNPNAIDNHGAQVIHFSDSIVVSVSRTDIEGLIWFFSLIIEIGEKLMMAGLPVRGGAALGEVYHENGIIFGPAMVEAYDLESKLAQTPRVILSKRLQAKAAQEDLEDHLMHNYVSAGPDFNRVDYIKKNFSVSYYGPELLNYMAILHSTIMNGLQNKNISVVGKYEWMRREYNMLLKEFSAKDRSGKNAPYVQQALTYIVQKMKPIE